MGDCGKAGAASALSLLPPLSAPASRASGGKPFPLPPLSAPASGGNGTKTYQFFKVRVRCASRLYERLQKMVLRRRARQSTWTRAAWERELRSITAECRGCNIHGGVRKNPVDGDNSRPSSGGGNGRFRLSRKLPAEDYKRLCARRAVRSNGPSGAAGGVTQELDKSSSCEASHRRQPSVHSSVEAMPRAAGPTAPAPGGDCLNESLQPAHGVCLTTPASGGSGRSPELQAGVDLGYRILNPALAAGTFGEFFPALWKNGDTAAGGQLVLVKHVEIEWQIRECEAREVQICRKMNHQNTVKLLYAVQTPFALDLIFEQCDLDLRMAMKHGLDGSVRMPIIRQLCAGLLHVHTHDIVHRDLKPANILCQDLKGRGYIVKIADFGCSRPLAASGGPSDKPAMTKQVTTLWYRSPEMLLGTSRYGFAVDMWSLGCVAVEVLAQKIAFPGTSEFDMLLRIFRTFGTPSKTLWFSLTRLPSYASSRFIPSKGVPPPWQIDDDVGRSFVQELLIPCPLRRITAKDAVGHKYFTTLTQSSGGNTRPASGGGTTCVAPPVADEGRPLAATKLIVDGISASTD